MIVNELNRLLITTVGTPKVYYQGITVALLAVTTLVFAPEKDGGASESRSNGHGSPEGASLQMLSNGREIQAWLPGCSREEEDWILFREAYQRDVPGIRRKVCWVPQA